MISQVIKAFHSIFYIVKASKMSSLSAWSLPAILNPPLTGRDAVADAVHRVLLGCDTNNRELFESAITENGAFILDDHTIQGHEDLMSQVFDRVAKLETTHTLTNTRINIDGSKAILTATVLAQHYRGGTDHWLVGGLYLVNLVREDTDVELWKIETWKIQRIWGNGDPSVVSL